MSAGTNVCHDVPNMVVIFDNRFFFTNTLFLLKNTILRIVEHWILGTFAMKKVSPECEKTHPSCVITIERRH